jgi:crotonobetainyl-CoA:carnitine CoA-transferase CaiB-like acyl-CoA transferase
MSDPDAPTPVVPSYSPTALIANDPPGPTSPLLKLGGLIGLAACLAGLAVLIASCGGVLLFSAAPFIIGAGALGLAISLLAVLVQRRRIGEETHVLLALFVNVLSIAGGLMEMAVLKGWPLMPK